MMRRYIAPLIFVVFLLALGVGCGSSEDKQPAENGADNAATELQDLLERALAVEGLHYQLVMTAPDGELTGEIWQQGEQMRSDFVVEGQEIVNIINATQNEAFMYMPAENMAIRMPLEKVDLYGSQTPGEYVEEIDPEIVQSVETVQLDGITCKLVTYRTAEEEVKLWLHAEYGLPLRAEVTTAGEKVLMEYKNLEIGPVAAEVFQLPAGVQVVQF